MANYGSLGIESIQKELEMKLQTFKERVWGEYNRRRKLRGSHQIAIKDIDDVSNIMLGKLVFLKLNIERISEVFKLETLYVVKSVHSNKNGQIYLGIVNLKNGTTRTTFVSGVTLVTNRILECPWFIKSVKKQFNLNGIKELSKRNLLSIINIHNMDVKLHSSIKSNMIMVDISGRFVESLITNDTDIACSYNKVIITGVSDERYGYGMTGLIVDHPYRITRLLKSKYTLENIVYLNYKRSHQYNTMEVDNIYDSMEYELSYLL